MSNVYESIVDVMDCYLDDEITVAACQEVAGVFGENKEVIWFDKEDASVILEETQSHIRINCTSKGNRKGKSVLTLEKDKILTIRIAVVETEDDLMLEETFEAEYDDCDMIEHENYDLISYAFMLNGSCYVLNNVSREEREEIVELLSSDDFCKLLIAYRNNI